MNIYIVRHGNPDYGRDCLTDLGHKQAQVAAEHLKKIGIDEIYSSPMGRAKETAQHLCDLIGKDMTILPWLEEIEHYSCDGRGGLTRTVQLEPHILRSPEMEALGDQWMNHPIFRGEDGVREMVETVERGAEEFLATQGYTLEGNRFKLAAENDKNVAMFCHAGVFLVLISFLLRIPQLTGWHCFYMNQAAVTWCHLADFDEGYTVPRCLYVNDFHHLTDAGLTPT